MQTWEEANKWEADWHGNAVNSFEEESKQIEYLKRMGLPPLRINHRFPAYDLQGKTVLDIGGGAYSILLKVVNGKGVIVDPLPIPNWCKERYKEAGLLFVQKKGEDATELQNFDEVWIYNCLQHVDDPRKVIANARKAGKLIRIFEWIDQGISPGHIHDLKKEKLDKWLGGDGKVDFLNQPGLIGKCYYGIFPTKKV